MDLIPAERREAKPPSKLGKWTAAIGSFHILYYEREVALPSVRLWADSAYPSFEGYDEPAEWGEGHGCESILSEIRSVRQQIVALWGRSTRRTGRKSKRTPWGNKTLYWVASKTYQHGIEHLSNVLRTAMLWEHYAGREAITTEGIEQDRRRKSLWK